MKAFTNTIYCMTTMLLIAIQLPVVAADRPGANVPAHTIKNATSTLTWYEHTDEAERLLHITEKEVTLREKHLAPPWHPKSDEVEKARVDVTEGLRLAKQELPLLGGLKNEQTALSVMKLVTCVGCLDALDAITVANIFCEFGKDPHQQLLALYQTRSIGKRIEALHSDLIDILKRAFGTDKDKCEFSSKKIDGAGLHLFADEIQKVAAEMHQKNANLEAEIARMEKMEARKLTWQEHDNNARKHFHITNEEMTAHAKRAKNSYMHPTPEEIGEGRADLNESLKLALKNVKPLQGLQSKQNYIEIMDLGSTVGYVMAVDSLTVASLSAEQKKSEGSVHHQLAILYRLQHITMRLEQLEQMYSDVMTRAFGNGDKVQFVDKDLNATDVQEVIATVRKTAAIMHAKRAEIDAEIARLRKIEDKGN